MIPIARTEKLLIQEVGNEVIVYDQENDSSHCLNPMAARVWELCDGQNTVNDIAKLLEKELDILMNSEVDMRGLVWLTLEELERYNLINEYRKQPTTVPSITRRKVVKTATLVGGFAIGSMFPVVRSIMAPVAAQGVSKKCEVITIIGATCTKDVIFVGGQQKVTCSDSGCQRNGGFCKQKPVQGNSPDCVCVKDINCTF